MLVYRVKGRKEGSEVSISCHDGHTFARNHAVINVSKLEALQSHPRPMGAARYPAMLRAMTISMHCEMCCRQEPHRDQVRP